MIIPPRIKKGDTIGMAAPSALATEQWAKPIAEALEAMGYRVKFARNLFANGWGYAASPEERAADINELIRDESVRMIFFTGGEGADDIVPMLDYDAAKADPKLWLSYSDGTSILNSIWGKTGVSVLYGQTPALFPDISDFDRGHFERFTQGFPTEHVPNSEWRCLTPGVAQGTLIGGYLFNFIYLTLMGRIPLDEGQKYVLFIEDHEKFFKIEAESALISRLEQCGIMEHVTGLLFGHYSDPVNEQLLERLRRVGERWGIPVAYCDDFGHGVNHAILPIGAEATLDTEKHTLSFRW